MVLDEVQVPDAVAAPFAIFSESVYVAVPLEFEPHSHPVHELVWVRGGTMSVRLADVLVTVPEGHGVWIPAGVVHSGRTTARTVLSDALFDTQRSATPLASLADAVVIEVTPILASLLTYLERTDLSTEARIRAEAVVFDVLAPAARQLSLRVPHAARVEPIVAALLVDPTDERTLSDWASVLDMSERTITRLFRSHTGLSFMQWRQVLRVHRALALLGEGLAVQEVSDLMGYAQSSTFIASFRRVMGVTPGAYVAASATVGETATR